VQRPMHEVRIEMTGGPGRDLHRGYAVRADTGRIIVGLEIALDDGDAVALLERHDRRLQQSSLAGARRGHEIDREHAVRVEVFAIVTGDLVVGRKQILSTST